jgi:hypothetical protein
MALIDLYVNEVGRNLPAKMREDIEKEIRSLIEDMLEDAAKTQGRQPDEQLVVDVLKQMGSPEKVAASYLPPRYLIGPKYFPTFWMVTRIVLTVILVLSAIGLGVQLGRTAGGLPEFLTALSSGFGGMISTLIAAFGNVVLVFAILQWLMPEPKFDKKEWDPRALKAEPDPERVKPAEMVIGIAGSIFLLLLLNVYPQWLGIVSFSDGVWVHVQVLTAAFTAYFPWISLLLVAGIALNAYLLNVGRWTPAARWSSIGINIGSIIMLGMMVSGPALVGFDPTELARLNWPGVGTTVGTLNNALNLGMRIALGISLVMQVIDVAKMLLRLLGSRISLPADLTR